MIKQKISEIPFINDIGQTINPGDQIISLTTSWSNPHIRKGVYTGLNEKNKVQILSEFGRYRWVSSKTGEVCRYNDPDAVFQKYTVPRHSTLNRNRIYKIA